MPESIKDKSEEAVTAGCQDAPVEDPIDKSMDHGLIAWLQVLGSWILFWNTWGLTNSYGVFQTFYLNNLLPSSNASAISWVGSVQLFLTMVVGIPAGVLLDAGHLHFLIAAGTLLEIAGLFALAECSKYWQIFLAQGICMGIGSGLLGLTSVAVIPLYFQRRKMIATGIAATGSSLAGILYPLMMRRLFVKVGFAWAVRTLAFLILGCMAICMAVMRLRDRPKRKGPLFNIKMLADKPYAAFVGAFTLMIASAYIPFFYIQDYALKLSVNEEMAFNLLSIMNAASLLGRLAPNWLADRYGGVHVMFPSAALSALILFFFRFVNNLGGLVAISVIYGFISGGMISLPPPIIASLTPNSRELGTKMGMAYTVAAFGGLVGNPIAGAAKRASKGLRKSDVQNEFQGVWLVAAVGMVIATGLLVLTKYLRAGKIFVRTKI
ncbi:MFS general substrate transporter [Lindgomyces ingoldianus]|uniref:MFS general substrate transporter n=1 Tax=Lindgomyces ingoldianus TaxID=673940 RepID=A0ACB6R770_9PLEO|nr:MFS general substrate transporter [Lindgomyces ingoldianus]KAF2475158.1 MFS general substrate transporter [Lindgomyces ingoldianus]